MGMSALSIALSGMRTSQTAIETTTNNVANAGTPGYTRQRVDRRPAIARQTPYGPMGSGVDVAGISRATDGYLDARTRSTSATAAELTQRSELAQRTEDLLAEPDNGTTAALATVWSSFSTLASHPTDAGTRTQVLSSLNDLAGRINSMRAGIGQVSLDALGALHAELDTANGAAQQIAELNKVAPVGLSPSQADQRDLAIDQLAKSVGGVATTYADGRVRVTVNGYSIVDGDRALPLTPDPVTPGVVQHPAGAITLGGTAGGLQKAIVSDLPGYKAKIDAFVTSLVSTINTAHAANLTPAGTAGGPLFADDGTTLTVVPTSGSQLAAADSAGGLQNGQGAQALANLRTLVDGTARDMVTGISGAVGNLSRSASTAQGLADAASQQRSAVTGVNLDEEMAQMIADQKAYAAAARIVTTVDQMLDTLIKM